MTGRRQNISWQSVHSVLHKGINCDFIFLAFRLHKSQNMFSHFYFWAFWKHLLQLFLKATKYNKNVKHSVQLYLYRTITIILLLFCYDLNKTYLSQALQSSQEKYLFAALCYSSLRFDSGLALGMWFLWIYWNSMFTPLFSPFTDIRHI